MDLLGTLHSFYLSFRVSDLNVHYRFLERKLNYKYTCEESLDTLKAMNFAEIQEQGFIPL